MEELEVGFDRMRKNFSRSENPENFLPRRFAFTIIICNRNDTIQSHTEKMHRWLPIYSHVCEKRKRNGDSNLNNKNIGYKDGIWHRKMYHSKNEKQRQITKIIELPKQERTRTAGEEKTYKYLGILKAVNIKQAKTKEPPTKQTKNEYFRRRRKLLKPVFTAGISSKE